MPRYVVLLIEKIIKYLRGLRGAPANRFLEYIKKATNGAVTSIQQAIKYIRENPMSFSVFLAAIVSLGASISDWLDDDPEAAKEAGTILADIAGAGRVVELTPRAMKVIEADSELTYNYNFEEQLQIKSLVSWLRRRYHTTNEALEDHTFLRMFLETKSTDLARACTLYWR